MRQKEGEEKPAEGKKEEKKPAGFSRTADEWKKPVSVFAQLKETAAGEGASCYRVSCPKSGSDG